MTYFTLQLHGKIDDAETLFASAMAQAKRDGWNDADEHLRPDGEIDIGVCVRTLLDPGTSPDGLSIDDSDCETWGSE